MNELLAWLLSDASATCISRLVVSTAASSTASYRSTSLRHEEATRKCVHSVTTQIHSHWLVTWSCAAKFAP